MHGKVLLLFQLKHNVTPLHYHTWVTQGLLIREGQEFTFVGTWIFIYNTKHPRELGWRQSVSIMFQWAPEKASFAKGWHCARAALWTNLIANCSFQLWEYQQCQARFDFVGKWLVGWKTYLEYNLSSIIDSESINFFLLRLWLIIHTLK